MTDPLMPAFCCKQPSKWTKFYDMMVEIDSDPYNYICMLSSLCGIGGAIYQILPQISLALSDNGSWASQRGRKTIVWLAVADFFASLGIFARSLIRLMVPAMVQRIKGTVTYCYLLSFWVQYFYVVSWMWTLIYAIDIRLALREQPSYRKTYHFCAWILPAIFTFIGLFILYYPNANCFCSAENSFWKFFPNYIVSYLPMLLVMIVNPVLYISATSSVHLIVSQYLSQYTNKERLIVDMIKIKFGLINLTFYACWLPNLVNTVLLYSNWDNLPRRVIVSLWYIMAIMNPLQALFNCLVYQKPHDQILSRWNAYRVQEFHEANERTPLLARRSGSSNNSEEPEFVL
ncbi:G-protein coupled receptor 143-like [Planococcus citri]|uniref:G-protein coupled receptor 143-like n=1 Tax=Planococcus citri TaxID=170843 RepID=UPI0031F7A639